MRPEYQSAYTIATRKESMTTFNENEHPRASSGQFTTKAGSEPDVRLLPDIQAPDISELAEMTPEQHRAIPVRPVADPGHWAYRSYQGEVANVFGEALREEHGGISVTDEEHKRLFEKAWDYGNDSGFYGVEQEYLNLVTSDEETEGTE